MNTFFENLFLLRPQQIGSIINVLFILLFIGAYLIPVTFLILDIRKRYTNKGTILFLWLCAIVFYLLFIIPYMIFRKPFTNTEDTEYMRDQKIQMLRSNIKECPKCDEICKSTDKFCNSCGINLNKSCTKCNNAIEFNWKHCVNCGNPLTIVSPQIEELKIKKRKKAYKIINSLGYKMNHSG